MIRISCLLLRDLTCFAVIFVEPFKAYLSFSILQMSKLRQAKACSYKSGRKSRRNALGKVPGICPGENVQNFSGSSCEIHDLLRRTRTSLKLKSKSQEDEISPQI